MTSVEEDFERFSQQHSWYKHLPVPWDENDPSEIFYLVCMKGQQPRNSCYPEIDDWEGMHWSFFTANCLDKLEINSTLKDRILQYPIHCNAFLRGVESDYDGGHRHIRNYPSGMNSKNFEEWLIKVHPDLSGRSKENIMDLFRREKNKSLQQAIEAVRNISQF
jgi:hypothetical protein